MIQGVHVWGGRGRTDARPVAAGEEEPAAALLDESASEPAEEEELAGVRVADLGIPKEDPPVVVRHFCFANFDWVDEDREGIV